MNKIINTSVISVITGIMLTISADVALAKRQVAMENTLRALDRAERTLRKAIPNKGGHRVKALRLIRQAKEEVRRGIEFANRRAGGGHYKKKQGHKGRSDDHYEEDYREKEKIMKKQGYKDRSDDRYEEEYEEKEKVMKKRY